jgi:hypothetical protein
VSPPLEVRLAAVLLVGGGLVFLAVGLVRIPSEGADGGLLMPPLLQLVLAVGVAGGLLHGMRSARLAGMLLALVAGLVHSVIALGPIPFWARAVSAVIAASQVYVAVLLNTRPALQHSPGRRR